jgi:hypothetical protein
MKQTRAKDGLRVDHWRPSGGNHYLESGYAGDGPWAKAFVYSPAGVVEVYSQGGPFPATSLRLYVHPRLYCGQVPRRYEPRSFPRLARRFAARCLELAAGRSDAGGAGPTSATFPADTARTPAAS